MARALKRSAVRPPGLSPVVRPIATSAAPRIGAIDALRGGALCMMFAYHFAFDLRYFGVAQLDFENSVFWLSFRAVIVASFLSIVGVSLVLADRRGADAGHFLRRVAMIAAAALAVTAASWLLFPSSFIYFGILHCIALASLLAWPLRRHPRLALVAGIAVLVAASVFSSPAFDRMQLSWIGFTTHKPITEDYVPLAPWSAAVFIGIALGHALEQAGHRPLQLFDAAPRWLRWLGRHSLVVYLVHQPLLMAVLWLLVRG